MNKTAVLCESVVVENNVNNDKIYTILTEEAPSITELKFIVRTIVDIDTPEINISPTLDNKTFNGEWEIKINAHNTIFTIFIKLFKGESSCVDYLVHEGYVDDNTNAGNALCILESTKTTDKSSRNTAVNQRITKFMVYDKLYPTSQARKIMFYNEEWNGNKLTDTGAFGLTLMKSLNIEAYHVKNNKAENLYDKYAVNVFQKIPELITAKNKIKEKLGNVSIKINNNDDDYYISCKLDKGTSTNSGKISHDPNVGLLSGLVNFIYSHNKQAKITIQRHNISQQYFDKSPKSKFWYAIHGIPIKFEHIQNITFPLLPTKYFRLEKRCTEKIATILCSQVMCKDYKCIFSNHSGCALSNIKTRDKDITVERTMSRPDILFHNNEKNELFIIEGKIEKDIHLGVRQLKDEHLERFIVLIKTAYPECVIKKGLCVTIDSIENIQKYQYLEYPVVFALDSNGVYYSMF